MPKIDIFEQDLTQATSTLGTDIPFIPGFAVPYERISRKNLFAEMFSENYKYEDNPVYTKEGKSYTKVTEQELQKHINDLGDYTDADLSSSDATAPYFVATGVTYDTPILCTSVESFKALFGDTPYIFEEAEDDHSIQIGDADRSYIMARELLKMGMPVYYYAVDPSENNITEFLSSLYTYFKSGDLADKDEYTIKYITTGGYANYIDVDTGSKDAKGAAILAKLSAAMLDIAETRGDAIVLVEGDDTINHESLTYTDTKSLYYKLNDDKRIQSTYAAAFIPWAKYSIGDNGIILPACYAYLSALAKTIKTGPNWLAIAGITRGSVPKIDKLHTAPGIRLSNVIANSYQPLAAEAGKQIALNAITQINPYGLTIWGNRTLQEIKEGTVAGNFLNTRNMASDIKKVAYKVAKSLMYEQNNDALWIRFKSEVSPYLEQLKAGSGISDYKLIRSNVNSAGKKLSREQFACIIKIFPVAAVESFEIAIVMSDADVEVQ